MHRRVVRPFGSSISSARGMSMLLGLAVLWMFYDTARDPDTWTWLAARDQEVADLQIDKAPGTMLDNTTEAQQKETVIPGPNDLVPEEQERFRKYSAIVRDRTELMRREMVSYWQLMAWGRTQTFTELRERARIEPNFSELWEDPDRFRGVPIRLKLNVRRVIQYDAPTNDVGVAEVFEAWGWTDNSKSYPYVVVFSDKPEGLPIGAEVESEVLFTGYFLKIMAYTAFDKRLAAPLLVGKVQVTASYSKAKTAAVNKARSLAFLPIVGVVFTVAGGFAFYRRWQWRKRRSKVPRAIVPEGLPDQMCFEILDKDQTQAGSTAMDLDSC